jgi:hypothetical protein
MLIRPVRSTGAAQIAALYNQGVEDRGATLETQFRTAADITLKVAESDHYQSGSIAPISARYSGK